MQKTAYAYPNPHWLRRVPLCVRWGGMSRSVFYDRLRKKLIPEPEYPFGPNVPYWRMDVIEAFEQQASAKAAGVPA